jgi:DNA replication protein DnaC
MSAAVFEPKAATALHSLGLGTAHARLDQIAQQAAAGQWSYSHFLGRLLDDELAERHRRTVALNLQFARFPAQKRLADFDPKAQPGLDPKLIDEPAQASLLFQIIAQRYDTGGAIVLTSNKPFADWAQVFAGDAVMAGAALDRLLHKATVVNIRGDSYRLRERRQAGAQDPLLTNPQPKDNRPAS